MGSTGSTIPRGPHFFGGGYASTPDQGFTVGKDTDDKGGKGTGGKDTDHVPGGLHGPIFFKGGKNPGFRFVIGDLGPRVTPMDVSILDFLFGFTSVHGVFLFFTEMRWHTIGTR